MTNTLRFYPMTRVEGHGGIKVIVDESGVRDAKVEIYEGPRLIERLVLGRTVDETLSLTCRICAICSISHRYACILAMEKALGIEVGAKTKAMRQLVDMGENIESNALHVYLLSLPDLLNKNSAIEMLEEHSELVSKGLRLKAFGNRIMEVISGRATHGENPIIGGFGKWPSKTELLRLKDEAKNLVEFAVDTVEFIASLEHPQYATEETIFMSVNAWDNKYGFAGDSILVSDGTEFRVDEYKNYIDERVVAHSFAKRSRYNGRSFTVGAIARIINMGKRLTGTAAKLYKKHYKEEVWKQNPMYNTLAQGIELVYCLEQSIEIIDTIIDMDDEGLVERKRANGTGTAAVEAPRGVLYHSYTIKNGRVVDCDIITPTAQNLDDIEKYVLIGARNLYGTVNEKELQYKLDSIARAYDPCISCSVHITRIK